MLNVSLLTQLIIGDSNTNDDAQASSNVKTGKTTKLVNGSGNGQAQKVFASNRTLAASASESLQLTGGTLVDPNNVVVSFANVKLIYVRANPANTNDVVVGNGTNPFVGPLGATGTVHVRPGAEFLVYDSNVGWPSVASTADMLQVANSGAGSSVNYEVVIVGT